MKNDTFDTTTIGLILVFFIFFIVGLSLVSMCVTIMQMQVENKYMAALQLIEEEHEKFTKHYETTCCTTTTMTAGDYRHFNRFSTTIKEFKDLFRYSCTSAKTKFQFIERLLVHANITDSRSQSDKRWCIELIMVMSDDWASRKSISPGTNPRKEAIDPIYQSKMW